MTEAILWLLTGISIAIGVGIALLAKRMLGE